MRRCLFIIIVHLLFFTQCKFLEINQPLSAETGEIIEINLRVYDSVVPEPNPHKGLLCILMPKDWSFFSGEYSGDLGTGQMELAPNWIDSIETVYPSSQMGTDLKWIALTSDTGYTYNDPITVNTQIKLNVGQIEGCFPLGYLVSKATGGLISPGNPSWAPLSFPHYIGIPDSCSTSPSLKVQPAQEWNNLLDRQSGWTGADGIYSIPLSGSEIPTDSSSETTLILFSDTFIGDVDSSNQRKNSKLVNNTYAILQGNQPVSEKIDFLWREDSLGNLSAIFVPNTPQTIPGDWYWLMDGISLNDKIYVFGLRLEKSSGGFFNFKVVGVTLISFRLDSTNVISDYIQVDSPLYANNEAENWEIVLGQAVMSKTEESGVVNSDGYIYVYGPKNTSQGKHLVVARVSPESIEDFSQWRYWDGTNWSTSVDSCASLTSGISQEFSVSQMDDGRVILVYQLGNQVAIRFGESPTGPFGFYQTIYDCPEVNQDPDIFVYNAKAHPHLSKPGQLLISYNVNTFNFWDLFLDADIYRPRFITLEIVDYPTPVKNHGRNQIPNFYYLHQNYPNPFNSSTTIQYNLPNQEYVLLQVFNSKGQLVRTLANAYENSGRYTKIWDGMNELGQSLASGVYFYQLKTKTVTFQNKLLLLR